MSIYTCNASSADILHTNVQLWTHSAPLHSYRCRFNNQQLFSSSNVVVNNSPSNVISHSFHSLSSPSGVCKCVHMYGCVSLLARTHDHIGTCGRSCTVGAVAGIVCVCNEQGVSEALCCTISLHSSPEGSKQRR